jgi:hypothetical protein
VGVQFQSDIPVPLAGELPRPVSAVRCSREMHRLRAVTHGGPYNTKMSARKTSVAVELFRVMDAFGHGRAGATTWVQYG